MPASSLSRLLARLGPEVEDPDEETFILFADKRPEAQNLGFIDAHAAVLDLTVAGRDLTIHQSPAVLTSNRSGGTTGAVLWKISPVVAEWLARPTNLLFSDDAGPDTKTAPLLGPDSAILELGCSIAGLIGLVLTGKGTRSGAAKGGNKAVATAAKKRSGRSSTRRAGVSTPVSSSPSPSPSSVLIDASFSNANTVGRYVLTDQSYVAKFLLKNLEENGAGEESVTKDVRAHHGHGHGHGRGHSQNHGHGHGHTQKKASSNPLYFRPLDWETDEVTTSLLRTEVDRGASPGAGSHSSSASTHTSFDAVLACDCIYNEALVAPLVQTFVDTCQLREKERDGSRESVDELPPTVCIVAQQLRDPDVVTAWLSAFHAEFRVWRVPDELMDASLRPGAGFAVHIGVLRTVDISI